MPQRTKVSVTYAPPYRAAMGRGTIHRRVNGGGVGAKPLHHSTSSSGSPPHELRSLGGAQDCDYPSLRRLLIMKAAHQLFGALPHGWAVSANCVGQEEVCDRITDRSFGLGVELGRRPWQVDQAVAAELRIFGDHLLAELGEAVERQCLSGELGHCSKDRPV